MHVRAHPKRRRRPFGSAHVDNGSQISHQSKASGTARQHVLGTATAKSHRLPDVSMSQWIRSPDHAYMHTAETSTGVSWLRGVGALSGRCVVAALVFDFPAHAHACNALGGSYGSEHCGFRANACHHRRDKLSKVSSAPVV